MNAPAYILIGAATGYLLGLAAVDFWKSSKGVEAPMTREAIYAQRMPMADERVKREDETCMYTSLNGRERGIPFTIVTRGADCVTILGATK